MSRESRPTTHKLTTHGRSGFGVRAPDDDAARLLVVLELEELARFGLVQQLAERAEAVVGLVEAGLPALERLLHHRPPDLFLGAALLDQRLHGLQHQVER